MTLEEFRAQNPAYKSVPDGQLADALYDKFYADKMPRAEFYQRVGMPVADAPQWVKGMVGEKRAVEMGTEAERIQRGAARGLRDPIDAGAQLVTRLLESVAPAGSKFESFARGERERVEQINKVAEQAYRQGPTSEAGRIGGNIAALAPLAAIAPGGPVVGSMVSGGLAGTMQPVDPGQDFWKEKAKQAAVGTATGLGAGATVKALGRVISPQPAAGAKELIEAGVSPTPGQVMGGVWRRIEEGAKSIPLLGDAIRAGEKRAVEQFNRTAINKALEPIGQTLPKNMPVGRQAVDHAKEVIGQAYDDLLPKLTAKVDQQFIGDVSNLMGLARSGGLPDNMVKQLGDVLEFHFKKISPNGTLTGQTLKEIESDLGRLAAKYGRSQVGSEQLLGDAFKEAQRLLRGWVERSNPQYADQLSKINTAYSRYLRVENAAGRLGSQEGVFSGAGLSAAVKSLDPSLRKGAYARGKATMQDFAEAGKNVLGAKVPDSGTAFRLANMLGLGALGGGFAVHPALPFAMGAAALPYAPGIQGAIARMMTQRPAITEPIASALFAGAPAVAAGAAPVSYGLFSR